MKLFMKILIVSLALVALAGLVSAGCAAVRAGYESAPYKVVRRDGKFELRDYPALVVAETPMHGADNSFMRLFHFISGENAAKQKNCHDHASLHEQRRQHQRDDGFCDACKIRRR